MGMFDDIVVHRKLPLPKKLPDELRDVKWKEVVFQTKCLDNCLTEYKIAVNGKLYAKKFDDERAVFAYNSFFDRKRNDAEMFWKNVTAPTSINFYTNFQREEFEYAFNEHINIYTARTVPRTINQKPKLLPFLKNNKIKDGQYSPYP